MRIDNWISHIKTVERSVEEEAKKNTTCLRKAVGCGLVHWSGTVVFANNGPSVKNAVCSNVVGNCGCSHAEPRAIIRALKSGLTKGFILVCTYSPCTNCANIIIDSGIVELVVYKILTEHDVRGSELLANVMPTIQLKDIGNRINEIKNWVSHYHEIE